MWSFANHLCAAIGAAFAEHQSYNVERAKRGLPVHCQGHTVCNDGHECGVFEGFVVGKHDDVPSKETALGQDKKSSVTKRRCEYLQVHVQQ